LRIEDPLQLVQPLELHRIGAGRAEASRQQALVTICAR
jgi:hypothetical protein